MNVEFVNEDDKSEMVLEKPESDFYTGKELAAKLNVSTKAIEAWTAQRRIPGAVKAGYHWRYNKKAIEKKLINGTFLLEKAQKREKCIGKKRVTMSKFK